jgi:hypothetical protein
MNEFKEWWNSLPKVGRKHMCEASAEAGWDAAMKLATDIAKQLVTEIRESRCAKCRGVGSLPRAVGGFIDCDACSGKGS